MERSSPIGCAALATVGFLLVVLGTVLYENSSWLNFAGPDVERSHWPDGTPRKEVRREQHGEYFERIETVWRRNGVKESEIRRHELTPDREERRYWDPDGVLDWEKSGVFERGKRILPLEAEEPRRRHEP